MVGLYVFYGIPAFILICTIVLKQSFSFFMANTLWLGYRIMIVFIWWIILFEEGHNLSSRILAGLFFAYPLFYLDEIFKILIWGWGNKFRYLNMFCRQIWVVLEK